MKHLIPALLLASAGANLPAQTYTLVHNSLVRTYILHLPVPYDTTALHPLVFNLHGYGSDGFQQQIYTQFDKVADTAGVIVVYPYGVNKAWDTQFTNSSIDDVGFISALADTLIALYKVDTARIYATGMSMGGFMSYRLACELSARIAAVASVAGPTTDSVLFFCSQNQASPPVLHIHGTADNTVPYGGDTLFLAVDTTIGYFVQQDQCPGAPVMSNFPDTNTADSCTVAQFYYGLCADSAEVILYKVDNGGHTWPGTFPFPSLGNTNQDISASTEVWKFFSRHRLKTPKGPAAAEEKHEGTKGRLRAFPNPFSEVIHVADPQRMVKEIFITDLTGRRVAGIFVRRSNGEWSVDAKDIPCGVYLLHIVDFSSPMEVQLLVKLY